MAFPLAVIQLEIDFEHPEENLAAALALAESAVARGARLIVLPEAFQSDLYRGAEAHAQPIPGPITEAFARVCGDAVIAVPLLERGADGGVYSACALVGRGGVLGTVRKTHLYFDPSGADVFKDSDVIRAGGELKVFEHEGVRCGVLLGFDAEFPEAFRTLALRGADCVLVALNGFQPDLEFLRSMARRNNLPIAVANRLGFKPVYPSEPEISAMTVPIVQNKRGECLLRCRGGSAILAPDGSVAAQWTPADAEPELADERPNVPHKLRIPSDYLQDERVLMAAFDLDKIRLQRLTSPLLNGRRGELYGGK